MVIDSDLPLFKIILAPKLETNGGTKRYSRSLVSGADFHDTIRVDLEGNLNLGNTSRRWGNP